MVTASNRNNTVSFVTAFLGWLLLWFVGTSEVWGQDPRSTASQQIATQETGGPGTRPVRGMVWRPPENFLTVERDLIAMRQAGVEAIRTPLISDQRVLGLADALGLRLYQDVFATRLPAQRLLDTLRYVEAILDTALILARDHVSARDFGVARFSDTSDSRACAYFERLRQVVRSRSAEGTRIYYITAFIDDDVCSKEVDFVLADVRDRSDPALPLFRWDEAGEDRPPLGIASLGTWVRSDTLDGLRISASPARQARYMEDHLAGLLSDTLDIRPPVVFVHRWRDVLLDYPTVLHDPATAYVQRYGLHSITQEPRPAYNVVSGIYTGRQAIFAFPTGGEAPERAAWPLILGWGVIVTLGAFYALSPRFRHMVPRYFTAHIFYRDSVREGRDALFGASTVLIIAQGVAAGIVLYVFLSAVRTTMPFMLLVRWMPGPIQDAIIMLLANPLVLVVLAGCVYVLALLLWAAVLAILSRKRYVIAPLQTLMLVVWPRWPLLVVMVAAMVVATMETGQLTAAVIVGGVWIVLTGMAVLRAVYDFASISHVPAVLVLPALFSNMGILLLLILAAALAPFWPELTFFWHAVTRT